jgi:hypothetical protein
MTLETFVVVLMIGGALAIMFALAASLSWTEPEKRVGNLDPSAGAPFADIGGGGAGGDCGAGGGGGGDGGCG